MDPATLHRKSGDMGHPAFVWAVEVSEDYVTFLRQIVWGGGFGRLGYVPSTDRLGWRFRKIRFLSFDDLVIAEAEGGLFRSYNNNHGKVARRRCESATTP